MVWRFLESAALALALALLLMLSNPAAERHEHALAEAAPAGVDMSRERGVMRVGRQIPRYRNLLVFSYTSLDGDIVTWGVLGNVWVAADAVDALRGGQLSGRRARGAGGIPVGGYASRSTGRGRPR